MRRTLQSQAERESEMSDPRNTKEAILKGLRLRCPDCGKGHLFSGYLKVAPSCEVCGLDFTPQRADDGPAYIVVLVVSHIMASPCT